MHYRCEIVLPEGTENIKAAVESVMKPFNENLEDAIHAFWDFWVIGGRFAGSKAIERYDPVKLREFYEWMENEKVTVSSVQCGKQEIYPRSQIPKVDEKWNEMFPQPGSVMVACPLFRHSNDQYSSDSLLAGDVCKLKDAMHVKCERLIFSAPTRDTESKQYTGPLQAVFMLTDSVWNGVNHEETKWDGTMECGLRLFRERSDGYAEEYRKLVDPKDDWLVVTVDYHT